VRHRSLPVASFVPVPVLELVIIQLIIVSCSTPLSTTIYLEAVVEPTHLRYLGGSSAGGVGSAAI